MLKEYTIKATIPTGNYANIQPEITVTADSIEQARDLALPHILRMFEEFSETPLKQRGICEKLMSFNENVEIDFDRQAHTYTYNGKRLESASAFVDRHSKPFDKLAISNKCSASWGIPQDTILSLWESNGNASAGFGTSIHAALEHYFKYRDIGKTILEKSKKDENAALPNHPLLRQIILGLEKIDTQPGEEMQEVLVSNVEMGYCGLVDKLKILDSKKKICRVQDYKVVYDIDKKGDKLLSPFSELSPTKLSKYQIQLSFYANLLAMSGWQVEGLDIFAFSEEWHKYPLEVLKVI